MPAVMFVTAASAMYGPWHRLHTATAVTGSTQPCILSGSVKWVSLLSARVMIINGDVKCRRQHPAGGFAVYVG